VSPRACSIAAAMTVLGEKWSLLVIRELALGVHRFD
jgi:DNA-binding HxlR family transcriptional regulator